MLFKEIVGVLKNRYNSFNIILVGVPKDSFVLVSDGDNQTYKELTDGNPVVMPILKSGYHTIVVRNIKYHFIEINMDIRQSVTIPIQMLIDHTC